MNETFTVTQTQIEKLAHELVETAQKFNRDVKSTALMKITTILYVLSVFGIPQTPHIAKNGDYEGFDIGGMEYKVPTEGGERS